MSHYPYGNDPAKVENYRAFWQRLPARRPMVGFSIKSWFPLDEYAASRAWQHLDVLTPGMIDPPAFLPDQDRLLREGEQMDDDILRGACPSQAVPWLDGMLGATLRILPGNILGAEHLLPWDEVMQLRIDRENPWYCKYMDFRDVLVQHACGRYPVSHGTLIGPTDLLAVFRGHTQSLIDLIEDPERCAEALRLFTEHFRQITADFWEGTPRFAGGYFDAQYQLWGDRPITRIQEDVIAVYSPRLYRRFVQPLDRHLANCFSGSFMHLHSTSMFVLELILEIEALRCLQVNYEVNSGGPDVHGMVPHWRRIQSAGRSLLIRGSFTPDELRALVDALDPRGLYLYIMVNDMQEVETLRPIVGM